ncbi:hypothetical protein HAX54_030539 [Datura stramonium]|uniref:Uncharacterized protein n=1 Tax=Datura stramonium TaxID=4076 RepID=A0ABS8V7U8_DATST|nr:hypothetical protein [Datura stramonium]
MFFSFYFKIFHHFLLCLTSLSHQRFEDSNLNSQVLGIYFENPQSPIKGGALKGKMTGDSLEKKHPDSLTQARLKKIRKKATHQHIANLFSFSCSRSCSRLLSVCCSHSEWEKLGGD